MFDADFERIATTGPPPTGRAGHAAAIIGSTLFVAGGADSLHTHDDAFALDLVTMRWRPLLLVRPDGATLHQRHFACSAAHGGMLLIVGGWNMSNYEHLHDDTLGLDTAANRLERLLTSSAAGGGSPGRRARHACAVSGESLYLFGGWDGTDWLDSTWRLHLVTLEWSEVRAEGFVPWPRSHACLVPLPPSEPGTALLFGGGDGNLDFDDVYVLHDDASAPGVNGGGGGGGGPYWERVVNASGVAVQMRTQGACTLLPLTHRVPARAGVRPDALAPSPLGGGASGAELGEPSDGAPDAYTSGARFALVTSGGFGGHRNGSRVSRVQLLSVGARTGVWRWHDLRASRRAWLPPLMGHSIHAVNATALLVFGGSLDGGGYSNAVLLLRPLPNKAPVSTLPAVLASALLSGQATRTRRTAPTKRNRQRRKQGRTASGAGSGHGVKDEV